MEVAPLLLALAARRADARWWSCVLQDLFPRIPKGGGSNQAMEAQNRRLKHVDGSKPVIARRDLPQAAGGRIAAMRRVSMP